MEQVARPPVVNTMEPSRRRKWLGLAERYPKMSADKQARVQSQMRTWAQLTPQQKAQNLESFEVVWRTVRDRHPDPKLNGLDWQAIHDSTKPLIAGQTRRALRRFQ